MGLLHRKTACLPNFIFGWLCLLIAISPSVAQTAGSDSDPDDDALVTINMHNADIQAVIQWIAEQTNKKIVIDPRVTGKVTVLANEPMTTDQAYQVFLATLDVHGYAAAESGNILRIFPSAMAKSSPGQLINNYQSLAGKGQVIYVIQAHNVSAQKLATLFKPLIPSSGYLTAYPNTNSLIIADEAENVKRLVKLARQIDETGNSDIDTIKLNHASASKAAGVIESLLDNDDKSDNSFTIASDERSNSLLMSGNNATRSRIKRLIKQLDQPISGDGSTKVIYLHYLNADEMLPILKGMSSALAKENDDNESVISIEASESANALVITAPPNTLTSMEKVIAQVDIRRAQVLIEAVIVEVNQNLVDTLGVQWSTSMSNASGGESVTNFGLLSLDEDDNAIPGVGLTLGFYRNGSLRALIQALSTTTGANILSTPSIMTLDNQEAEIIVGKNVPFITGKSTSSASGTNNPFTTIERQDVGIELKIKPQINEGDSVTLEIAQEVESIEESATVVSDIVTSKRSINTKVLVADNTILVLGGLITDKTTEVENKVPFLGDLPLIGEAFKSTSKRVEKENLMVFIRPVIVDSEQIGTELSSERYQIMEDLQEKFHQSELPKQSQAEETFETFSPRKKKPQ